MNAMPYMGENMNAMPYMGENMHAMPYMGENINAAPVMGANVAPMPSCVSPGYRYCPPVRRGNPFALIVVLFILLIIVGACGFGY